ncbi:MAG TPA: hypothetical protein VGV07_02845 [Devosia sp.]|jgi:hypothetical protein|uniref:hypothetical protein n=1 Tax=Devosia sp. TaxID=1871048 RepID=UPI002DDD4F2B|nr:hypothetical protein [Devosia sp.]HEV2514163.1 hypothetical protein [Devosia sp.]
MPRVGNKPSSNAPNAPNDTPATTPAAPSLTPLDFLLAIMRDETATRSERVDAANKAAPYLHSKHATVDHRSSDGSMRPTIIFEGMPKDAEGSKQ